MMADQAQLQAQRSGNNVFAFRRLKWGDPPAKFRVDIVLRRGFPAPVEVSAAERDDDPTSADGPADANPAAGTHQGQPVADLIQRRVRERIVDLAIWGAAFVSVAALIAALVLGG
ncbi:MAG TPA: hypothetical protein VIL88_16645 [Devosia sp.]|jgi:hypothetical protein|uniref:hypothetical protein n=1 Tax=Devosia sp. TaxID=1871048 RepID=UPI002F949F07